MSETRRGTGPKQNRDCEGAAGAVRSGPSTQTRAVPHEILFELSRATTAYYEATPDRVESARLEYEAVLRKLNTPSEPDLS